MQTKKVIKEIENLKADTSKVIRDLTILTSSLTDEASTDLSNAAESIQVKTAQELKKIRIRLGTLNKQLSVNVQKADKSIHDNPYPWLAGAMGCGVMVGLMSRLKRT